MKTKGLGKLLLLTLITINLTSCKEEEFYEKEFIETLSEKYEKEQLDKDILEDEEDIESNDSGSNDSGSNDSGSNDSGSSDSGSNDSGSNDSDSNDSGSNDSGSNDSGSNDSGSNDSGSNDSGSNDSGSNDNASTISTQEDQFTVQKTGNKLDIVWVIDNSGSMSDEQAALGQNFDAFIREFISKGIDFQMAITTTDTSGTKAGREWKDSMSKLTSSKLSEDENQFLNDFEDLVKVGIGGSGWEKGIQASESFAQRYNSSWLRQDAYLTVVYVSDEEDQSPNSVDTHLNEIKKYKNNDGLIKAYSIVDMVQTSSYNGVVRGYERYNEISQKTGGEVASIKSDFHDTLLRMGEQIAKLSESYPLSKAPKDNSSIQVLVNGSVHTQWQYDSTTNSILFNDGAIPAENSIIKVSYDTEE